MSRTEAEVVLREIEGILHQVASYHHLSHDQQLALHTRARQAGQKVADIAKLLKKLDKIDHHNEEE